MEIERADIYGLTRAALAEKLKQLYAASPFRSVQLFEWLYRRGVTDFACMTNISQAFRAQLPQGFEIRRAVRRAVRAAPDGTRKYLWEVCAGIEVESVLIPQAGRNTLCISTQQGCAMGCAFCRTAAMGLLGNLSAGDIIRQAMGVLEECRASGEDVSNIVFMGMGEPLHNLEAVLSAIEILSDPHGLSFGPRKITVSTAGLVPGIDALAKSGVDVRLAVSLNAVTNELRSRLMPINRTYPLEMLIAALKRFPLGPRRRITIEYVLMDGVNDSDQDLEGLLCLLDGLRVKVNLIPYNPSAGSPFRTASKERLEEWRRILQSRAVQTNIRWSKGAEIGGGCGQLAVTPEAAGTP